MLLKNKTVIALLLLPQIVLVKVLSNYPDAVEHGYSRGVYVFISRFFRAFLGWLPVSFGDVVYAFLLVFVLRWCFKNRQRFVRHTKAWFIDVFAFLSVFYFTFHVLWGFNYYRQPLYKNLNLESRYTTKKLVSATQLLITKANAVHLQITNNDSVKVVMPYTKSEVLALAPLGYLELNKVFDGLDYGPVSVKKSLFSLPLSYMGFSGYLNPFFNEAQVNSCIPIYKFATTATHEMAHQLGFAAENEANFIGCLAAVNHTNVYFKYCGYTFGLRYCLNEIYRRDKALYNNIIKTVNAGVLKNYKDVRLFWEAHKNPTEPLFKSFYNGFLKANKQTKGIGSYSYVVALLVNYIDVHGGI